MLKTIKDKFNFMEEKTKKILKNGIYFSIIVCAISALIFITYHFYSFPDLYYIGLAVFKLGLFFIVEFVISAIAIDTIRQQI